MLVNLRIYEKILAMQTKGLKIDYTCFEIEFLFYVYSNSDSQFPKCKNTVEEI